MKYLVLAIVIVALAGCRQGAVEWTAETPPADLEAELAMAKAKLEAILPQDMRVTRSELLELDEGVGILLHAFPKDVDKGHPSFALFLWPKMNPKDIAYETGEGSHTFRRMGSSEKFRVYYSNLSGLMKEEVGQAFCTKDIK